MLQAQKEYKFSNHALKVLKIRKEIKEEWIWQTIEYPFMEVRISDSEIHLFRKIDEFGGKVLKVIINPEKKMIITAFFDRRIKI